MRRERELMATHGRLVLLSHGLDHVVRPLANHLGVECVLANRLEFRAGLATGRLLDPVVPPWGVLRHLVGLGGDGVLPAALNVMV